jgi:selenocysteine lyase/cysteine desulfurase
LDEKMAAIRAYLDYNASAPLLAAAREAMVAALDVAANPSSVHAEGRAARRVIETARRDVAALVNAKAEHVVFTSGATEAASTLLTSDWQMGRGAVRMSRLYVSEADHPCLLNGGRFPAAQVTRIGVDANGIADLGTLAAALRRTTSRWPAAGRHPCLSTTRPVSSSRSVRSRKSFRRMAVCSSSTQFRPPVASRSISMRSAPIS